MKIDEAISLLKQYIDYNNPDIPDFYTMEEACKVVIEALEQEPCEDVVSRQAVIDTIDRWVKNMHVLIALPANEVTPLFESVHKLPSVTPQLKMGKWRMTREEAVNILKDWDGYFIGHSSDDVYNALDMAIKALEQEHCDDAVSRDKAIVQLSHLQSDWDDDWNVPIRKCIETIKIVPPVTPKPKMGQWSHDGSDWKNRWICSECGYKLIDEQTNYCPNCGADMRGDANVNDK